MSLAYTASRWSPSTEIHLARHRRRRARQANRETQADISGQVSRVYHSLRGFVWSMRPESDTDEFGKRKKKEKLNTTLQKNVCFSCVITEEILRTKAWERAASTKIKHAKNVHTHTHEKWLTAVAIITQAAELGGHSTICSLDVCAAPHPPPPPPPSTPTSAGSRREKIWRGRRPSLAGASLQQAACC